MNIINKEVKLKNYIIYILREALDLDNNLELTLYTKLSDLPFDSLNFIKLIVDIEDKCGIKFEEDKLDISNFATINAIVEYVKFRRKEYCELDTEEFE